ncbi:MAG: DNA polymerase III subunit delta [Betaproteobacteria bacterium RIFCSPLOWO2_02_FULL_67_26]|nr:MAG: DNA polymerase III subunit delta [Betaproteobacteria bacterium RIFCSPLOWO2_02_FULL_67_26]
MRISTEQLQPHLARELKPLYAVFGDETLLALEASDRIRARARAEGHTERTLLTADAGFKWSELAFASNSRSLFATRRILELRIPTGKPGVDGSEVLQRYCEGLPPDTITLIALPGLEWRTQKSGWFEALDRAGVLVEAKPVARKSLPEWLAGRLRAQNQEADPETLDFIAERVEGNLLAAHQEVQKLALLFPAGKIAHEQAREAVLDVARYDVFKLGEALLEGDVLHLARMVDGLKGEGIAPPLVLWAIANEVRAVGRVLDGLAAGKTPPQLWRDVKVWGPSHQSLMQQNCRRFSREQVESALLHAAKVDRMVKGLIRGDVWDELLQLTLRFAPGAPAKSLPKRGKITAAARAAERSQPGLF